MLYEGVDLGEGAGIKQLSQSLPCGQFALLVLGVDAPLPTAKPAGFAPLRELRPLVRSPVIRALFRVWRIFLCWLWLSGCDGACSSGLDRAWSKTGAGFLKFLPNFLEMQAESYLSRIAAAT